MIRRRVVIKNRLGLHARAAAQLVKTANGYRADILVGKDGMEVNAKSIMGILMLAAAQGTPIDIMAEGEDAEQAVAALETLVNDGFGEN